MIVYTERSLNFDVKQVLDADKERLESTTGHVATRDIVQFVPFRDVQGKSWEMLFNIITCT